MEQGVVLEALNKAQEIIVDCDVVRALVKDFISKCRGIVEDSLLNEVDVENDSLDDLLEWIVGMKSILCDIWVDEFVL